MLMGVSDTLRRSSRRVAGHRSHDIRLKETEAYLNGRLAPLGGVDSSRNLTEAKKNPTQDSPELRIIFRRESPLIEADCSATARSSPCTPCARIAAETIFCHGERGGDRIGACSLLAYEWFNTRPRG